MGSPEAPLPDDGDAMSQIIDSINATLMGDSADVGVFADEPYELPVPELGAEVDPILDSRQQIRSAWQELSDLLKENETAVFSPELSKIAGLLLYTLIGDAIADNDRQQVEQYVTALDGLAIPADAKAAGYMRAIRAGYKSAEISLHAALLSEWSAAAFQPSGGETTDISPLLRTAVELQQDTGGNADTLITSYALGAEHALRLRLLQLKSTKSGGEFDIFDIGYDRNELEERIVDDFANLDNQNILKLAENMTDSITNPFLRLRIMDRVLSAVTDPDQIQTAETHELVEGMFSKLLWNDLSGGDPTVDRMAEAVRNNHKASPAPIVDAWEIDQRIYAGNTPEQIVAFIDERTSPALSQNAFGVEADIALANRDTLLCKYAGAYAAHHDFNAAKLCLEGIGNPDMYEAALHACIKHSNNVEELQTLHTSSLHEEIGGADIPSFSLAMASYTGDTEKLCDIAKNLAGRAAADVPKRQTAPPDVVAPSPELGLFFTDGKSDFYLYSAYKLVDQQNPGRGRQLAADVLDILRTRGGPQNAGIVQCLSDALVRDGDGQELRRAYDAIPQNEYGQKSFIGMLRLLNLRSTDPIPHWLQDMFSFVSD